MTYQDKQLQLFEHLEEQFRQGKTPITLVPPMTNYATDNQLCLTAVVFLPNFLQQTIEESILAPLRFIDPHQYYYIPNSFHLTIQNIRTVADPQNFTEEDGEKVKNAFATIIPQYKSFSFDLKRLFELPTSISLCGFSDNTFGKLVTDLRKTLIAIGLPDDKTYASNDVMFGNVSLCRFTEKPSKAFVEKIQELKNVYVGELEVKKISLITTNAVCRPEKTRVIEEFILAE